MRILPREEAKLLLHQASCRIASGDVCSGPHADRFLHRQAGFLAQKRLARGLQLNQTEAVALIASQLQERIRDGKHSVAELMQHGKTMLGRRHVLPGVSALLHEIQVEGTFPDGYVRPPLSMRTSAAHPAVPLYARFSPHDPAALDTVSSSSPCTTRSARRTAT